MDKEARVQQVLKVQLAGKAHKVPKEDLDLADPRDFQVVMADKADQAVLDQLVNQGLRVKEEAQVVPEHVVTQEIMDVLVTQVFTTFFHSSI